nr:PadR family transcriptional regulator [Phytoactinopolyspora halophila]
MKFELLGLIRDRASHGYEVKTRYDELLDPTRLVQAPQVYSTLKRLERDGLVRVAQVDQESGPERRTFEITGEGERELDEWLWGPVEPEPRLHTVLYTKVVLALLAGRSVEQMLDVQREAHLGRMRELTGLRQSGDTARAVLAEYALFHLEADLRWLEFTAARVDDIQVELNRHVNSARRLS